MTLMTEILRFKTNEQNLVETSQNRRNLNTVSGQFVNDFLAKTFVRARQFGNTDVGRTKMATQILAKTKAGNRII